MDRARAPTLLAQPCLLLSLCLCVSVSLWLVAFPVLRDSQIPEAQIRRGIMPLDADVPRLHAAALARVGAGRAVVGEVGHLDAVDPAGHVVAVRYHRQREPLAF